MKKRSINVIDSIQFYIADDEMKIHAEYATQIVYLQSNNLIVKLDLYLGQTCNYINWIEVYDAVFGKLMYSKYEITSIKLSKDFKQFMITQFRLIKEKITENILTLYTEHKLATILALNLEQLLDNTYQQSHVNNLHKTI